MSGGIRVEERIFYDVEICAQQHLVINLAQRIEPHAFFLQCLVSDESAEEVLDFFQVTNLKQVHVFSRGFQDAGDRLIIEQEMNPVHTLGEKMLNLVQVRIADL